LYSRVRGPGHEEWTIDNVVPLRAHRWPVPASSAAHGDDDAPASGGRAPRTSLLGEEDLRAVESAHPGGLTAVQIIDTFTSRGIKLSEASFRKYVQQGLLPRSKRVGRKGKHKGSLGVYPAKTVRRINDVKRHMLDGYTIEQIQGQLLLYTDLIETVEENLDELWRRFTRDHEQLETPVRRELKTDLTEMRRAGDRLVAVLRDIARRVAAPQTDTLRLAGAAGGAEDLL
jgi:hypothetical protein